MAFKHFRILSKQTGVLTISPTFRQIVNGRAVEIPSIDMKFDRGKPIWNSAEHDEYDEESLEKIRQVIEKRIKAGDDCYTFLTDEQTAIVDAPAPEVKINTGARMAQHQATKAEPKP